MLSLYIHIPFCENKCKYCNFFVLPMSQLPEKENFVNNYLNAVINQVNYYAEMFAGEEIKTIYFGGGTPLCLGKNNIKKIMNLIKQKFNLEYLEEISFELNPMPFDETIDFIKDINLTYKDFFRIRYSFGIQSFDDKVLEESGRDYYFNYLVIFFRELQKLKMINNVFNFDFIAFGKFNKNKSGEDLLWDAKRFGFFESFVDSGFADSFSVYTLELFPGSFWFDVRDDKIKDEQIQENIHNEFEILKSVIQESGYKRYEISNFALAGKQSIHNGVYWNMGDYIGIGLGAHSFLKGKNKDIFLKAIGKEDECIAVRFETNKSWKDYFDSNFVDKNIKLLDEKDVLLEEFFLGLRTSDGVASIDKYKKILIKDYMAQIIDLQAQGVLEYDNGYLRLKDAGMDVYNYIITNLID